MNQESLLNFKRPISNIVFMGMGEPLMNYNNVLKAIQKLTSNEGLGISPRRITLSTSGIPKIIRKIADEKVKFRLAVSLHSAIQNVRERIMPFANKFKLDENKHSSKFFRIFNEIPTILLILIVFIVVFKPI